MVTLAEAQVNTQDDVIYSVIDSFRRYSWLLDNVTFDDCVNPVGNGGTLTYGYTRLVTPTSAGFRAFGDEFATGKAVRERKNVDLVPMGGKYELDRVLARLGPAATNEMAFQSDELVKATRSTFQDEFINGDTGATPNGFDGLDVALAGSSTELNTGNEVDWTAFGGSSAVWDAIALLDDLVGAVNSGVTAILGNRKSIARVKMIAGQAGYLTQNEDSFGRFVDMFGPAALVDLGDKNDGSGHIIPIETRDPGGDGTTTTGLTDLYAVRLGLDALHAVSVVGDLVSQWDPDYSTSGAVKQGEVELGPAAMVLKSTRGAAVLRNVKVTGS